MSWLNICIRGCRARRRRRARSSVHWYGARRTVPPPPAAPRRAGPGAWSRRGAARGVVTRTPRPSGSLSRDSAPRAVAGSGLPLPAESAPRPPTVVAATRRAVPAMHAQTLAGPRRRIPRLRRRHMACDVMTDRQRRDARAPPTYGWVNGPGRLLCSEASTERSRTAATEMTDETTYSLPAEH